MTSSWVRRGTSLPVRMSRMTRVRSAPRPMSLALMPKISLTVPSPAADMNALRSDAPDGRPAAEGGLCLVAAPDRLPQAEVGEHADGEGDEGQDDGRAEVVVRARVGELDEEPVERRQCKQEHGLHPG